MKATSELEKYFSDLSSTADTDQVVSTVHQLQGTAELLHQHNFDDVTFATGELLRSIQQIILGPPDRKIC